MSYEVKGKLKVKFDTQTFSSGFEKREFVVTTNETYAQEIKLELVKDKCSLIDKFKEGQELTVSFNLRGNFYEPKNAYYNSLQAWKIEAATNEQLQPQGQPLNGLDEQDEDPPF